MMVTRRQFVVAGGMLLTAAAFHRREAWAAQAVDIAMGGAPGGAHVWFRPAGVLVQPGQHVRWTNHDLGNSHTATSYDPTLFGKPRRIPEGAKPWDSGFLLPGESYSVTLTVPGVYDYYCLPHELAGMVGRIIVAHPVAGDWQDAAGADRHMPAAALQGFPSIESIMRQAADG